MKRSRMAISAAIGFLISVLVWSLLGGCQGPPSVPPGEIPPESRNSETLPEEIGVEQNIGRERLTTAHYPETAAAGLAESSPLAGEGKDIYYTVKNGDTLWSISRCYGLSIARLAEINRITDTDLIGTGKRLRIPR